MKQNAYAAMNAKLKGLIAEACELDNKSCAEVSQWLGYGPEFLQKKGAAKALPELKVKDAMLLAMKCGMRIKFEEAT